jgi:rhodanese-related sulfurtransferase
MFKNHLSEKEILMKKCTKWTKTSHFIVCFLFGTGIFFQSSIAAENKQSVVTSNEKKAGVKDITPDGELINGVRVIHCNITSLKREMYVNRGEEVKLIFVGIKDSSKISMPELSLEVTKISTDSVPCTLEFKADKIGTFSVTVKGVSQTEAGNQITSILVQEFEHTNDATIFKSISPTDASKMIKGGGIVLDVRTQKEYDQEHLNNAVLIPVQQLAQRIGEVAKYKDSSVVVYCRAGNRSITASEILINNGFKKVFNINKGIMGWKSDGLPVVK